MVNMVTAEEEELAVWDYPRPSSPWEYSVKAYVESVGYDYDAYSFQISNVVVGSPPPISPLWEYPNTHIPQPRPSSPTVMLPKTVKSRSPPATRSRLTISVPNMDVVVDLLSQINASIWDYTFNNPNNAPNFTYQIQPHLVSINLTQAEATRLLFPKLQCTTDEATNKGYLSVGKYSGLLFSEKILKTSGSVSNSEPRPSKGEICFSTRYGGQTIMAYLSTTMSTKECVALSVRVDTGDKDHPLSMLIAKTNQRIISLGKRRRAANIFASEDVPTHFAANFVDTACRMKRKSRQYADPQFLSPYLQNNERSLLEVKAVEDYEIVSLRVFRQTFCNTSLLPDSSVSTSQICNLNGCNQQSSLRSMCEPKKRSRSFKLGNFLVSSLHETPMQHMPAEFVREDSLFCPPQPEQLTRDTVLHMNHTFPPESTILPKCNSFQSPVEDEAINNGEGHFSSASQSVNASGNLLKNNKRKIARSIKIEDLRPYYGKTTRAEAAESLGVSVSTLKRICREHEILRWPYRKLNKIDYSPSELKGAKTGGSVQSLSLTMPIRDALPSKPLVQARVQYFHSDAPYFNPPPRQLSTVTAAQTSPPVTIKATYDGTNTIIKFDLPSSATMDDLEGEVAKRLKLNVGCFTIKYQDQEGDWISVTGFNDLQYCIHTLKSLPTIRMLVQSTSSGPT